MSEAAVEVSHLWKKFYRGEWHDSLRDLLPAITRRLLGRRVDRSQLGEGDFWAVRDVSFRVDHGDVLGIIGPNGAGKSTLLKILSLILKPTLGSVKVRGRLRALIEVAAGFHGDLTGRENVYLNGTILGMKKREIDAKFDEIVAFSGIESFLDTPVKRYSSGMFARLGFAVAAHLDPEILIVDEVLAVGDLEFQKKCLGKMGDVARSGRTVLFVSHSMESIRKLCGRCILLDRGELVFDGAPEDAVERYLELNAAPQAGTSLTPPKDPSAPGAAVRVAIEDLDGQECSSFPVGRMWQVRVRFAMNRPAQHAIIAVGLIAGRTTPLWTHWSEPCELEPGEYEAVFRNESVLLAAGSYAVAVGLSSHERSFHYVENAAVLEIAHVSDNCERVRLSGAGYLMNPMRTSIEPCTASRVGTTEAET